jgi:hypothetical protein
MASPNRSYILHPQGESFGPFDLSFVRQKLNERAIAPTTGVTVWSMAWRRDIRAWPRCCWLKTESPENEAKSSAAFALDRGAPRSMKTGTIVSPWRGPAPPGERLLHVTRLGDRGRLCRARSLGDRRPPAGIPAHDRCGHRQPPAPKGTRGDRRSPPWLVPAPAARPSQRLGPWPGTAVAAEFHAADRCNPNR